VPDRPRLDARLTSASTASDLQLLSETSWVTGSSGLRLRLRITVAGGAGPLDLALVLYSRLQSRSEFDQTLQPGPFGYPLYPIDQPPPIPLESPTSAGTMTFDTSLHLPVTTDSSTTIPSTTTSPVLNLANCNGPECDGVYPLTLALSIASTGRVLSSFTTHLVYVAPPAGSVKMAFSLVLPVSSRVAVSPSSGLRLTTPELTSLSTVIAACAQHPLVATTLEIAPASALALEQSPRRSATAALHELRMLALQSASHQVLSEPFAPIALGQLARSGLAGDIGGQLERGDSVLAGLLGIEPTRGTFVSTQGVDIKTVKLLRALGVDQVVIPRNNVVSLDLSYTPTAPFMIDGSESLASSSSSSSSSAGSPRRARLGGLEGMLADGGLAAELPESASGPLRAPASNDPVLASQTVLADLAQIFFDEPFAAARRGVVLVVPRSWTPNSAFLSSLLSGLGTSPIVQPTTLNQLFSAVPLGANAQPTSRELAPVSELRAPRLPVGGLLRASHELRGLASLLPDQHALLTALTDDRLLAESTGLASAARSRLLSAIALAVSESAAKLSLPDHQTITITSTHVRLPITIVSDARGHVHLLLQLSSPELRFPDGATMTITLTKHTTTLFVPVTTRVAGLFPLRLGLSTPLERLSLVRSEIEIRSTAYSGVAIALSGGALFLLLLWWVRSSIRRRRVSSS